MSAALQQFPMRRSRGWLVPLLVLGLMGMIGFCTVAFLTLTKDSDDGEPVDLAFFLNGRLSSHEIRSRVGEDRFWRSLKSSILNRPTESEIRFHNWLADKRGRQPPWLQAGIDRLLSRWDDRWGLRTQRVSTALRLIAMDLKETAIPVLPELVGMIEAGGPSYSHSGIKVLRVLHERGSPVLPALFRILEHTQLGRPDVVDAINVIDLEGDQSTLQFIALLQKTSDLNRAAILPIIGRRAQRHPALATNLWPALEHDDRDVVLAAVRGLAMSRQLTSVRLESFRPGFHSADTRARWLSLNLVSAAWPNAGRFLPELREAASHKSADQPLALTALRSMLTAEFLDKDQRLAAAEAMIASDSAGDAWEALTQLEPLGADADQILTLATKALGHPSACVRAKAADILGQMGPSARPALPQLRALRQDQWNMVRDAVESALPKIGGVLPPAEATQPAPMRRTADVDAR